MADEQEPKKPLDDRVERLGLEPGDYYFSEEGYLVFTERYCKLPLIRCASS